MESSRPPQLRGNPSADVTLVRAVISRRRIHRGLRTALRDRGVDKGRHPVTPKGYRLRLSYHQTQTVMTPELCPWGHPGTQRHTQSAVRSESFGEREFGAPAWSSVRCCCPVEEAFPTTPMGYAPIPNRKGAVKARPIERCRSPFHRSWLYRQTWHTVCGQGFRSASEASLGTRTLVVASSLQSPSEPLSLSPRRSESAMHVNSTDLPCGTGDPSTPDGGPSESPPAACLKVNQSCHQSCQEPHATRPGVGTDSDIAEPPIQEPSPDPSRCPEARRVCVGPRHSIRNKKKNA